MFAGAELSVMPTDNLSRLKAQTHIDLSRSGITALSHKLADKSIRSDGKVSESRPAVYARVSMPGYSLTRIDFACACSPSISARVMISAASRLNAAGV